MGKGSWISNGPSCSYESLFALLLDMALIHKSLKYLLKQDGQCGTLKLQLIVLIYIGARWMLVCCFFRLVGQVAFSCSILSQNRHPFPMQPAATAPYGLGATPKRAGGTLAEGPECLDHCPMSHFALQGALLEPFRQE